MTYSRSAHAIIAPWPHSDLEPFTVLGAESAVVVRAGKTPDVDMYAVDNETGVGVGDDCAATCSRSRQVPATHAAAAHQAMRFNSAMLVTWQPCLDNYQNYLRD